MIKTIDYEGHVIMISVAFDTGKRYSTIDNTAERQYPAPLHRVAGIVDDVMVACQHDVSSALLTPIIANMEWECKRYVRHGVDTTDLENQLTQLGFKK